MKICIFFFKIDFVNYQFKEQFGLKKFKKRKIFNDRRIYEKYIKKKIILMLLKCIQVLFDYGIDIRWQLLKKIILFIFFYRNLYVSVVMCFSFCIKVNGVSYIIIFVVILV